MSYLIFQTTESILLTSIIGIIGVIIGAGLTFVFNWLIKSKEARLRVVEKVFDRRLKAYEDLLQISKLLRTTVSTKMVALNSSVITYPGILSSSEMLESFQGRFFEIFNFNSHWYERNVLEELYLIQDYMANIEISLKDATPERFVEVAIYIKDDLLDLAASLENECKLPHFHCNCKLEDSCFWRNWIGV